MNSRLASILWLILALAPLPATALDWEELSAEEQRVLAPLKQDWADLPPERQERLRRGAHRWKEMTPEERARVRERFRRWQALGGFGSRRETSDRWTLPPRTPSCQ